MKSAIVGDERVKPMSPSRVLAVGLLLVLWGSAGLTTFAQYPCDDLDQRAAQFRNDRVDVRHAGGERQGELRAWGGRMHRVMCDLERCIVNRHLAASEVARLLGAPDRVVQGGRRHATVRVAADEQHWLYWWRGGHDYLYFVIRDGRVASGHWWMAGE